MLLILDCRQHAQTYFFLKNTDRRQAHITTHGWDSTNAGSDHIIWMSADKTNSNIFSRAEEPVIPAFGIWAKLNFI